MNLFDMTRDDRILFSIVIVSLAIPSFIKPVSLWLGKKLKLVKANAVEESIQAMQELPISQSRSSECEGTLADSNGVASSENISDGVFDGEDGGDQQNPSENQSEVL